MHAGDLQILAEKAKQAEAAKDPAAARKVWADALQLLPPETVQYRSIKGRIDSLDTQIEAAAAAEHAHRSEWAKWAARFGPAAVVLWKFKAIAIFVLAKGKLLLLGLTKLSTFTSMLASFGLYWTWYGWRFALGFVISIYIHEMGHVAALRRYGIAASAPMFVPGLGAFVMLKQRPATVGQDARVGLAGPFWGLGAAVAAWFAAAVTGAPLWYAVARTGAWINLFNLIPVWQLDGSRGFSALTRTQRLVILAIAGVMWAATHEPMLLLVALGSGYRLFTKDWPGEGDRSILMQFASLIVLLSMLFYFCETGSRPPM